MNHATNRRPLSIGLFLLLATHALACGSGSEPTGAGGSGAAGGAGTAGGAGGSGVVGGEGGGGAPTASPDPTRFVDTGSLSTPRTNHTATLLADGRVAVVGGERYDYTPLTSIELYDRSSGTFSSEADLLEPRTNHTATRLSSGEVLVVGGGRTNAVGGPAGKDVLGSVDLFDPMTGMVHPAAPLSTPRSHHTATLLSNGRVLVVGGASGGHLTSPAFGDAVGSVELYDPTEGTWRELEPLAAPRFLHTATLLADGRVLVVGGSNAAEEQIVTTELFDPDGESWSAGPAIAESRVFHASVPLADGGALVVAGKLANVKFLASSERLASSADAWTAGPELPESRTGLGLSVLPSGHVLATAGLHGSTSGFVHLDDALVFDPALSTWTATGPLSTPRVLHTSTTLPSGEVLIVGGLGASSALASAELAIP